MHEGPSDCSGSLPWARNPLHVHLTMPFSPHSGLIVTVSRIPRYFPPNSHHRGFRFHAGMFDLCHVQQTFRSNWEIFFLHCRQEVVENHYVLVVVLCQYVSSCFGWVVVSAVEKVGIRWEKISEKNKGRRILKNKRKCIEVDQRELVIVFLFTLASN